MAYEIGLVLFLRSQDGVLTNKAHETLLMFFDTFGLSARGGLFLGGAAIVVVLIVWHVLTRDPWRIDRTTPLATSITATRPPNASATIKAAPSGVSTCSSGSNGKSTRRATRNGRSELGSTSTNVIDRDQVDATKLRPPSPDTKIRAGSAAISMPATG